jgi:hypothetical protein
VAAVFDWIKLVHYVTSDQVRKRASWCEGESICELNRGCGVCYGAAQSSAGETGVSLFLRGARPEMAAVKYLCWRHKRTKGAT